MNADPRPRAQGGRSKSDTSRSPREPRAPAGTPRERRPESGRPGQIEWLVPALAVLVALGIRLWALRLQPWVTVDGTEYVRFAESLATGHPFASIFPPGYPALIAISRLVVTDRVAAAAAVSVIAGALLPWPVWALARRAVGTRWAALPALAVALHPILIQYSAITMSESAYLLALYAGLAIAAARRPGLAGMAIGAAFAIRPEALLPAAALALREGRVDAPRLARLRSAGLLIGGLLILAVPCWLYFHATLGQWTLTPKLGAFRAPAVSWRAEETRSLAPAADSGATGEAPGRRLADALSHAPANAALHGHSLLRLWPAPLALLSLWGLFRRRGIEAIPLLHVIAIPFLGLSQQPRFLLSALPSLAILSTVPLAAAASRRVLGALGLVWLAGASWCGVLNRTEVVLPVEAHLQAQKDAGEWLSRIASPGDAVMDRKPHLAFYARLPYRVIPEAPYDELLDQVVKSGARYLVLEEGVMKVFRPQLVPLIYDRDARDRESRLEMIYAGGYFKGYGLMIFRVLRLGEAKTGKPPVADIKWIGAKQE